MELDKQRWAVSRAGSGTTPYVPQWQGPEFRSEENPRKKVSGGAAEGVCSLLELGVQTAAALLLKIPKFSYPSSVIWSVCWNLCELTRL